MIAPIWMASPPEVHSALLSTGPGPGPLLAAAAAWGSLSTEYAAAAEELEALLAAVRAGSWSGPAAASHAAAHAPYLAWLAEISANSAATATRHEIAAAAYTTALAAMPTLTELAANHATHAGLVATNFFGINTIPIALNEADYARMWVQAATVMSAYQGTAAGAVAAAAQTAAAPQILQADSMPAASVAAAESLPPDRQDDILQWLQQNGFTDFYYTYFQPLIDSLMVDPFFQSMFSGFDPWLPVLGNPLSFLSPFNIAFALGYPMDFGSYSAFLAETFAFIGADLIVAFASGNPTTIGWTLVFVTVEAIGTVITDTIALLKTLLEQNIALLAVFLPLITASLAPVAAVPATLGGLSGLAGIKGLIVVVPPALPATMPPVVALAPTIPAPNPPPPAPVPGPASAAATAPVPTPGPPPPTGVPPTATGTAMAAGMDDFAYLVGGLSASAGEAAAAAARRRAPEPDNADGPAVAATPDEAGSPRRRRRAGVTAPGRGYEYMDLEPETPAAASPRGAGMLGFAGTAARATAAAAAGLTTVPAPADGAFGGGAGSPMIPATWKADPPDRPD
jgi:PPE-repeat protein